MSAVRDSLVALAPPPDVPVVDQNRAVDHPYVPAVSLFVIPSVLSSAADTLHV